MAPLVKSTTFTFAAMPSSVEAPTDVLPSSADTVIELAPMEQSLEPPEQ